MSRWIKPRRATSLLLALYFITAPSTTFSTPLQEEIDRAPSGGTLTFPAGRYEGPITVTKPLTLRGEPGAEIVGNGEGNVITIQGEHVTIEGFRISGSGLDLGRDNAAIFIQGDFAIIRQNHIQESLHGIYVKKANDCRIEENTIRGKEQVTLGQPPPGSARFAPDSSENCEISLDQNRRGNGIHLWNSQRAAIIGNDIRHARDGIYLSFTNRSRIIGNIATQVRFGLHYMYSDYNLFEENRFEKNDAGAVLMYSKSLLIRRNTFAANVGHRAYGIVMVAVDNSRLEENRFTGNSIGLFLELSNSNILLSNTITHGYIGVRLTGSSDTNRFSRNLFSANLHPVEIDSSLGDNDWAIDGAGNHWGTAEIDLNGDGIGDLPHRETDLLGALRRPFPMVALLSGSPAIDLVRFAQHAAPLPRVPTIVDPAPLVRSGAPSDQPSDTP